MYPQPFDRRFLPAVILGKCPLCGRQILQVQKPLVRVRHQPKQRGIHRILWGEQLELLLLVMQPLQARQPLVRPQLLVDQQREQYRAHWHYGPV